MSFVLQHLGDALRLSLAMFWQVLWPLVLGFLISAVRVALVPKQTVARPSRPGQRRLGGGVRAGARLQARPGLATRRPLAAPASKRRLS